MDTEYRRAANITIVAAGFIVLVWIFLKYLLGALMPLLLGAAIAAIISPLSKKISRTTKIPRKAVSATLVIVFFSAMITLIYLGSMRLITESGNLIEKLSNDPTIISGSIDSMVEKIRNIGLFDRLVNSESLQRVSIDIDELLNNALNSIISSVTSAIPTFAVNFVAKIPEFLFFVVVFLISAFYFSTDRDAIGKGLSSFLPKSWQEKLPSLKARLSQTVTGYLKAYFFIMLLTFAEVFIGLSMLRVDYALLLAILISVVDILPILGTGTILIPWAAFSYLSSDPRLGTGLLILYGIVLIVRQIAEPKIVGNSIGLHPLATLASVYLGIRFAGFLGIFIGPVVALCIKGFGDRSAEGKASSAPPSFQQKRTQT